MNDPETTDEQKLEAIRKVTNGIPSLMGYYQLRGVMLALDPDCIPAARTPTGAYFYFDDPANPTQIILVQPEPDQQTEQGNE